MGLEKMILNDLEDVPVIYPHKIQRTRIHGLMIKGFTKKYQIINYKPQIIDHLNTRPLSCLLIKNKYENTISSLVFVPLRTRVPL